MKQINITRDSKGNVTFEEVSIDVTENVFFTNLDTQAAHWPYLNPNAPSPDFCDNQIGPAPSPNSSQCTVPVPAGTNPPYTVTYKCKSHPGEQGTISVFAQLAAGTTTLPQVSVNTPFAAPVQVVVGGKSPYTVTGQQFQVTDNNGNVIKSGQGSIGPGLLVNASTDNQGISVAGIPSLVGTYQFTFTVNDAMGKNLQQVQYSMKVV
jgi:uncharacterized protein affecting Mg2+/Co2+ transport